MINNIFNKKLLVYNENDKRWYNKFDRAKPLFSPSRLLSFRNYIFEKIPAKNLEYPIEFGTSLMQIIQYYFENQSKLEVILNSINEPKLKEVFLLFLDYLKANDYLLIAVELHLFSPKLEHYWHGFADVVVKTKNNNYKVLEIKTHNEIKSVPSWKFQACIYDYIISQELSNWEPSAILAFNRKQAKLSVYENDGLDLNFINKINELYA
ncbi:MAG: hypothetical protein E7J51_03075 [Ureaplasma parvum]|uniref:PD-(D/E)XK endonuclease-like domain-containing protein n=1 Tax=Ureaplasma parvum TaxID=134821 RepID=Q0ZAS4_UREPR|nr:hypothetical protein [Ureaplasma parvum]ABG37043.1 hypothetical protein UU146 [Ureaplasma parvum]ABG37045.1 hypothetical protein UU146 [Ureaplasma parvum]ABG37046.1 hypothetical protein UU146 [Ureaplasma parvum]MDU7892035.1 hypothetical protein [Ureaplasma parvum]